MTSIGHREGISIWILYVGPIMGRKKSWNLFKVFYLIILEDEGPIIIGKLITKAIEVGDTDQECEEDEDKK